MEAHMYPLGLWEHNKSHLLHAFRNRVGFYELFVFICSEEAFKIVFYCDKGSAHWVFPQYLLETKGQSWKSVCSKLQSQNQSHLHSVNWACVPGI